MKQVRILSVFSFIFNIAIIGMVIYGSAFVLGSQFLNCIHYFTVLSNILIAIVALICLPFNFNGILHGKTLPKAIYITKLVATTLIGITFFVATFFLSYLDNWNIAKQYGNFQFNDVQFFFHLLVPVASMLAFIFFDRTKKVKFAVNFLAIVPFVFYSTFYLTNYFLHFYIDPLTNDYDWYGFTKINGLVGAFIALAILIVFSFALSALLFLLNKLLSKSLEKGESQPQLDSIEEQHISHFEESPIEAQEQEELINNEEIKEVPQEKPIEESEQVQEEPIQEEQKPEPVQKKVAPQKKATPKKAAVKKPEPEKKPAKETGGTKVYHLTKRKDDDMWAITFVGGKKPVKLFRTKKEAEEYLEVLTKNQGATALIRNSKGAKAGKFASSIKSDDDK